MVFTKNMARKQHFGLPKAKFPVVPTGRSQRDLHYKEQLQLPSGNADWTSLTPTFAGVESPEVRRAVDRLNVEHANPPPQMIREVCDLVQDLQAHPPINPVEDTLPTTDALLTPTLWTETVAETVCPPLLLARRATATPNTPPPLSQPSVPERISIKLRRWGRSLRSPRPSQPWERSESSRR